MVRAPANAFTVWSGSRTTTIHLFDDSYMHPAQRLCRRRQLGVDGVGAFDDWPERLHQPLGTKVRHRPEPVDVRTIGWALSDDRGVG
jgi:hypothetical protein